MSALRLFLPITKIDEEKRLVYGVLTQECPDKAGEIFDYESGKPAVQAWSDEIKRASGGKSLGNVRAMHDKIAAGKFTDIQFDDDNKRIEGAAKIIDDDEWEKCKEGVYTGFSIGGSYTKRWQDPTDSTKWRFTPELTEVSLVDNPCVPTATFQYIKADGSAEMRKFTPSHKEDSMDPKALADAREALAKGTATDEEKALIATADAEMLKAAQEAEANGIATDEQKALIVKAAKVATVKDGKPVKPKAAPVQFNKWQAADGSFHDSKREAEVRNLEIEKQAELAPSLAQIDALMKGAKKPAEEDDEDAEGDDEETKRAKAARREKKAKEKAGKDDPGLEDAAKSDEDGDPDITSKPSQDGKQGTNPGGQKSAGDDLGKKDYSDKERDEMAESGEALPDGSYPIKNKKDLENAIHAYGRAKDKAKAKAHIMARAKALGAEEMLPEDWKPGKKAKEKSTPKGKLEKGLHQVGWLAHLLNDLQCLQNNVEFEQMMEGDKDSELPAKFKSLVSEMCEVLVALVEEETEELMEGDDEDVEVLEMAAGLPAGHPEAIAKFTRAKGEPLVKSDSKKESEFGAKLVKFAETLEKAGARHSKADMERVQKLHDHAEEVHKCMDQMAEKCMKMHKAAGEAKNTAIALGAEGTPVDDEPNEPQASGSGATKMSKLLDEIQGMRNENSALTKILARTDATLQKVSPFIESLQETIRKQDSRIDHLERQPMPGKGNVRSFSKAQDNGGTGDGKTDAEFEAELAKLSPAERAHKLMKLALANPLSR